MQELPDGVYAQDGADHPNTAKRSVSSAEVRAHAMMIEWLYENLQNINNDKTITTVTEEGLAPWEKDMFSVAQDGSQSFLTRKQNLLAKYRAKGGINYPAIKKIVAGILDPVGLSFDILPYSGTFGGAWIFEQSLLGLDTYLAELDPINGSVIDNLITPLNCDRDYTAAGLSLGQMEEIERTAYLYEVRIYGHANQTTLDALDLTLTQHEPARSDHVITNDATGPLP